MFLTVLYIMPAPAFSLGLENARVIVPSGMDGALFGPSALWYDSLRGFLVVVNTQARRVVVLNRQGQTLKVLGKNKDLGFPIAVTGDREGTLFVAARNSETLMILDRYDTTIDEEYRTLDLSPHRRSSPVQPVALYLDKDGTLYVADRGNRQVLIFDRDGNFKSAIHDVGEPADLWVERTGKLLVADPGFGGIRVFNEKGMWLRTLGAGYTGLIKEPLRVRGLAADRLGRIWVVEESGQRIKAIDSLGNLLLTFAIGISFPVDLAIDDQDNLYVLDQGGNRIAVFRIVEF